MEKQTDTGSDGNKDTQMDKWMEKQTDTRSDGNKDTQMEKRTDIWMESGTNRP
ncbi:hypothetical protein DPMN_178004 [Dreissena polymorpha]|uniref:Uncharacterized protein n=1 Tax=Dreissena polymorpha TaxID=45954 RepID=A0A9D4E9S3_DREPO|nr:hypothetical protein DPMN_178004 [Dreissena polymorpha]